jgi:transporter family-2 protein
VPPSRTASPPALLAGASAVVPVAVLSGTLVAVQSRLNGSLRLALGDALLAAVVSFGIGLVIVAALVLSRPQARAAVVRVRAVPWWSRLGGLGGALLVAVSAYAAPVLGVALLTVGVVGGQTAGGALVDRLGIGPGGPRPLSPARLGGALLCLVAVGLSALGGDARAASPSLLVLVVLSGVGTALQQGLNGRVRDATEDASVAVLLNFVVGTAALVVGLGLHLLQSGLGPRHWPGAGQLELYLGGPLGVVFVLAAAILVRQLGVLRLGLAVVAGQLVGAVLLDLLAPLPGAGVHLPTVLAAALTLVAVAVSGRGTA